MSAGTITQHLLTSPMMSAAHTLRRCLQHQGPICKDTLQAELYMKRPMESQAQNVSTEDLIEGQCDLAIAGMVWRSHMRS